MFDSKIFNPEVFGRYLERIPNLTRNELVRAGVFNVRSDLREMLSAQAGGNYITIPMFGLIGGDPLNYDGATDITATTTDTYSQSMVVVGRAKAWTEKDFSYDITSANFMDNVAQQVAKYWETVDQKTLLSVLKGIFSMTGTANLVFVNNHTLDVSGDGDGNVTATTLNSATQKAAGDNKGIFKVAIMHSVVATNLENQNLLERLKYTDPNGIQRDLGLATWNGRMVIVDDDMPVTVVPGTAPDPDTTIYDTYLLGAGAFTFCNCGAKVPYEMDRDPKTNGGVDTLYTRQRKLFAPYGITFTKSSMATLSPTTTEIETAANWTLVNNGSTGVINHRAIPIARIRSLG